MLMIVTVMVTFILTTVFVYNVLQGKVKSNPIIIGASSGTTQEDIELIETLHRFR